MLQIDEEAITWTCNGLNKICQTVSDTTKKITQIQILKFLKDQKILKRWFTASKLLKQNKIYMTKQ